MSRFERKQKETGLGAWVWYGIKAALFSIAVLYLFSVAKFEPIRAVYEQY